MESLPHHSASFLDRLFSVREQQERTFRERSDVSEAHTQALKDSGIVEHLALHNQRHRTDNPALPEVDQKNGMFGVHLVNSTIEIRGWWDNAANGRFPNLRQDWRWTVRIREDGCHLLGLDIDEDYRLLPHQSQVLDSLALDNIRQIPRQHHEKDDYGVVDTGEYKGQRNVAINENVVDRIKLAPKEKMSANEVIDYYIPGEVEEKLKTVYATSKWFRDQLIKSPAIDDNLGRVMVLLVKGRSALKDYKGVTCEKEQMAISEALGDFLSMHRSTLAGLIGRHIRDYGSLTIEDMIVSGQIGVMEALERFDLSLENANVLSFCYLRALGTIVDELRAVGSHIRLPRREFSLHKQLARHEDGKIILSEVELSQAKKARESLLLKRTVSLDEKLYDDTHPLIDLLGEEDPAINPEDINIPQFDAEELLSALPYREQTIIRMYLGIYPYTDTYSMSEIGREFNVSESRISQLYSLATNRLKFMFQSR